MKATVVLFIDKHHPRKDSLCAVSVRITHNRKKKYYATPFNLSPEDFAKVMGAKPREPFKTIRLKLSDYERKATEIIEKLPVFTFLKFEEMYFTNKAAADGIKAGFESYIRELKEEGRIGTAVSYECAMNSIEAFKPGMKFADVDARLLKKYEKYMLESGKSRTTLGIYLRSLRTIFNRANVDRALYPFGQSKGKYQIPSGRNVKKALSIQEISLIFQYNPKTDAEARAMDYWKFIYLCNGLNMKDLCRLKWKNIDGDLLIFERAKTIRSRQNSEPIRASIKPEAMAVIKKWGLPSISPEGYVFPHLSRELTAEQERAIIQQLTKQTNKYMKRIAAALEINKPVTTYFARHSFATILRNSGASPEFISEALGHADLKTTRNYLAGFEEQKIHEVTEALTAFKSL